MSNEQTVREVFDAQMEAIYDDDPPYECSQVYADRLDLMALGIDPDMTVTELQRRLRIAERVLGADNDGGSGEFLAWLTRDGDQ